MVGEDLHFRSLTLLFEDQLKFSVKNVSFYLDIILIFFDKLSVSVMLFSDNKELNFVIPELHISRDC
jgi:hypothetical protein